MTTQPRPTGDLNRDRYLFELYDLADGKWGPENAVPVSRIGLRDLLPVVRETLPATLSALGLAEETDDGESVYLTEAGAEYTAARRARREGV